MTCVIEADGGIEPRLHLILKDLISVRIPRYAQKKVSMQTTCAPALDYVMLIYLQNR